LIRTNRLRCLFKPSPLKRAIFFVIADAILLFFSFSMAYQLRFNFHIPDEHVIGFWHLVWILVPLKIFFFYIFKVYFIAWKYFVFRDVNKFLNALVLAYFLFMVIVIFFYDGAFPRTAILIDFLLSFLLLLAFRFSKRFVQNIVVTDNTKPTLIIGANNRAMSVIASSFSSEIDYFPVAIIDDDRTIINSYLSNIKVHSFDDLEFLVNKYNIKSAIITNNYKSEELDRVFEQLSKVGVTDIKLSKLLGNKNEKLIDLSIEDLLARPPKDLDLEKIASFVRDKVIMVTGAGGSIGSEIVRQCDKFGAKKLILLDHSEYNLYTIYEEIKKTPTVALMQSVVDRKILEKSFKLHKPEIVIHAAAYKHVPLCEDNIEGAILNNIIGTKNTVDLSIECNVQKFIFISTDKAVRPTNVMGTTKRICELYIQNVDSKNTLMSAVRFGNVLGSSGSVIPKFKYQIENNIPLSVTDPEITRYFMLIPEACQLVLQAASIAKNRELFILDMGEPIKIIDLAKKMLKIYGKSELGMKFVGLRSGEKLYEELLIDDSDKDTIYDSIFVASPTTYDINILNEQIERLLVSENRLKVLKEIVPEFNHKVVSSPMNEHKFK